MESIEKLIGRPALLDQLAEEASELAQAALKLSRILRGENPTPVTELYANANLKEEFTDVVQCACELGLLPDEDQMKYKNERWHNRIKEHIIKEIKEANKNGNQEKNNNN
jgi:hypothetical protein